MRYVLALLLSCSLAQANTSPENIQKYELVGLWTFDWSGCACGWIGFYEDGTFHYQHGVDAHMRHTGTWKLVKDELTLVDRCYDKNWNLCHTVTWQFKMNRDQKDLVYTGESGSWFGTKIMLSYKVK